MTSPYVITAYAGPIKVVTTLHGPITPERVAAEKAIARHRAEMLNTSSRPLFRFDLSELEVA